MATDRRWPRPTPYLTRGLPRRRDAGLFQRWARIAAANRNAPLNVGGVRRLRQWSAMSPELRQVALTAVPEGSGQLVLREIEDDDLGVLFEHSSDRDAIRMAAFTSPEFDDRASFDLEGRREVTYWIGREDWGRGIATRGLQEFLQLEATRPLYAGAASDNV